MAIIGPSDLPYILKVDSEPLKKYALSKLGYPSVEIEVSEDQWESVLRTSGDFIAHYFSKEQMFGVFYTTPLENTYPLPANAYWVQEVAWDPATTSIDQIFSAEAFLFCFADGMQVVRDDGVLVSLQDWQPEFLAKTPYGPRSLVLERHETPQELVEVSYGAGKLRCTPNHPLKVNGIGDMIGDWAEAQASAGNEVVSVNGPYKVESVTYIEKAPTTTVYAVGAHCFYGCYEGEPILVH